MKLPEGIIKPDDPFAQEIGFISAGFADGSYLWGVPDENKIWITVVISKVKGAFASMMKNIEALGLTFIIPTPLGRMIEIAHKQGWKIKSMYVEEADDNIDYLTNR